MYCYLVVIFPKKHSDVIIDKIQKNNNLKEIMNIYNLF